MTTNKYLNQFSLAGVFFVLIMVFLIALTRAPGNMVQESDFIGTWTGVITTTTSTGQIDNPVDMTVTSTEGRSSAISYSFHYGPPISCRLDAVKATIDGNVISLIFKESSGGYCDKFWKKGMTMELLDKNHVRAIIQTSDVNTILTKKDD